MKLREHALRSGFNMSDMSTEEGVDNDHCNTKPMFLDSILQKDLEGIHDALLAIEQRLPGEQRLP